MKKSLKLTTLSSAVVLALGLTTSFASLASSDDDDYKKQTACFDTPNPQIGFRQSSQKL